jgi:hypothetical protein
MCRKLICDTYRLCLSTTGHAPPFVSLLSLTRTKVSAHEAFSKFYESYGVSNQELR